MREWIQRSLYYIGSLSFLNPAHPPVRQLFCLPHRSFITDHLYPSLHPGEPIRRVLSPRCTLSRIVSIQDVDASAHEGKSRCPGPWTRRGHIPDREHVRNPWLYTSVEEPVRKAIGLGSEPAVTTRQRNGLVNQAIYGSVVDRSLKICHVAPTSLTLQVSSTPPAGFRTDRAGMVNAYMLVWNIGRFVKTNRCCGPVVRTCCNHGRLAPPAGSQSASPARRNNGKPFQRSR